jgi:biotin transport system substrate-specific component
MQAVPVGLESAPMSSITTPDILQRPVTLADLLPLERITPGVRDVALIVGGAALTALAAQLAFTVPWTPVPYTLQTGAVLLVGTALGSARGALAMLLYVLVGAAGLPVFAEGSGGAEHVIGATGGYLVGFIVAATVVGYLAQKGWDRRFGTAAGLMVIGTLIVYAIGVPVLAIVLGLPLADALQVGALVFLPWDLAKVVLAAGLLPYAWRLAGERD